jgi:sphingomyelin phosphodiesterase acid-like 3
MKRHAARLLALVVLLIVPVPLRAQAPATWLFVSDIHLDATAASHETVDRLAAAPVADWDAIDATDPRPVAGYGTDTNLPLFRLALAAMKNAVPDPQLVVIPGDFLAHTYRKRFQAAATDASDAAFAAFVDKTMAYIAYEFGRAFPHAQFFITLGNNDSPCGDYRIQPHGPFYAHAAQAWEPLVNRDGRAPDFVRDFSAYGDYTAALPDGTRAVAVNSNAWSPLAEDTCDPGNTAPRATIDWLEHTVKAMPHGARTWVVLHVPPGIDPYATLKSNAPVSFYRPELLARLRGVRAADGAPLGLIVAGHLHNDGFRIVDQTPLLLVPSVSPVHGNNPAFVVAKVTNGQIVDDAVSYLDDRVPASATAFVPEYDFDEAYQVQGFTVPWLRQFSARLRIDRTLRADEANHYVADSPRLAFDATDAPVWETYWCASEVMDVASFLTCKAGF